MRDALNSSSMIRFDWNDETIVAYRHELILNGLSRSAHQIFKRTRDARAQNRDLMTNVGELRTGAIVQLSTGQYLVVDARDKRSEIARQIFNQLPQHRCV